MRGFIEKAASSYSRLLAGGASLSMFVVFLIVFVNSVRRYSIGKSLEWGEELPIYIAIYGVMFGSALAYLQDRHIRFTILVGFLPEWATSKLNYLVDIVVIVTGALFTKSGYLFMMKRGGIESPGLINLAKGLKDLSGIKEVLMIGHLYPYQAAMIVGGAALTLAALLRLFLRLSEKRVSALEMEA